MEEKGLFDVIALADFLQMEKMKKLIDNVEKLLSPETAILFLESLKKFNMDELYSKCLSIVRLHAEKAIKSKGALQLSHEIVRDFLMDPKNEMTCLENDLLNWLVEWGKQQQQQPKQKQEEKSGDSKDEKGDKEVKEDRPLNVILRDLLPLIRFHHLKADEIRALLKKNLLSNEFVSTQLMEMVLNRENNLLNSGFIEPRRRYPDDVFDDTMMHAAIQLDEKKMTCTKKGPKAANFTSVRTREGYVTGIHKRTFQLDELSNNNVMLGVCSSELDLRTLPNVYTNQNAKSIHCNNGYMYPEGQPGGPTVTRGEYLTLVMDLTKNTLSFVKNNRTFNTVNLIAGKKYHFYCSLYNVGSVSIVPSSVYSDTAFPAAAPASATEDDSPKKAPKKVAAKAAAPKKVALKAKSPKKAPMKTAQKKAESDDDEEENLDI